MSSVTTPYTLSSSILKETKHSSNTLFLVASTHKNDSNVWSLRIRMYRRFDLSKNNRSSDNVQANTN